MGFMNTLRASFPPKARFTEKELPNQAGKVRLELPSTTAYAVSTASSRATSPYIIP